MNRRHPSTQAPLPAQAGVAKFSERKLYPLSETINGLPAYGNAMGKRFTVEREAGEENAFTKRIRIKITEVVPDRPSFVVLADILVSRDSICIASARNQLPGSAGTLLGVYSAPPDEWKGFDFFGAILNEVKSIALERNISVIETIPNNKKLMELCLGHGFIPDPDDLFGRMVYRIDSAKA